MLVPINLTGGDYQHKSRPLTKQVTRNFWPQLQSMKKARSEYILQTFYGLKPWASPDIAGVDRGALANQGKLYKITGNTFYEVSSAGVHTARGTVAGSNRCIMWALGAQIIIVNGSGVSYVWDGTTFTQNTSVNLGAPRSVCVLNNQAIYDSGSGQSFDVSDVGTPLVINGLNNAQAESASDQLLRVYAYRETLYLMGGGDNDGKGTIELWYNSGQGNPPFDKIQGAVLNVGLDALHSVADNPDFVFFFGADKQVHTLTPGTTAVDTVISTPAMAEAFQNYAVTNDAIGWTMELQGQWFYCITFPIQNATWVYPVGGEWFEWGTGDGRIRANSYVYAFGKHLVADVASGNIYELDADTYTDAGEKIVRTRDSAPLHGGLFKQDGKKFELNELKIILETGVGLLSGEAVNPQIAISFSRDGGKTFGTERFVKTGRLNRTRTEVILRNCGTFTECVIRVRVNDPIYWAIYNAAAEIDICI